MRLHWPQRGRGKIAAKDEVALLKQEDRLRQEPGFRKVSYLGGGQYGVTAQFDRNAGEPLYFPSKQVPIFAVTPRNGSDIEVSGMKMTPKDLEKLKSIDAKMQGF